MGGVAFQLFVVFPFRGKDKIAPPYLINLASRFQKIISPLLLILIVTGGVNIGFRRAGFETIPNGYIASLAFKLLLVATVVCIHFFSFVHVNLDNTFANEHETQIRSLIRYGTFTLIIGMIIIFIAAMLRQWKF
jgi:hypothetical protein